MKLHGLPLKGKPRRSIFTFLDLFGLVGVLDDGDEEPSKEENDSENDEELESRGEHTESKSDAQVSKLSTLPDAFVFISIIFFLLCRCFLLFFQNQIVDLGDASFTLILLHGLNLNELCAAGGGLRGGIDPLTFGCIGVPG